jgi:hypothetical protein
VIYVMFVSNQPTGTVESHVWSCWDTSWGYEKELLLFAHYPLSLPTYSTLVPGTVFLQRLFFDCVHNNRYTLR